MGFTITQFDRPRPKIQTLTIMTIVTFNEQGQPKEQQFKLPNLPKWSMAKELGYEPKTTFWQDFSIADRFGTEAIKDTYRRAVSEWRDQVMYIAELSLVLNHKAFWYQSAAERRDGDKRLKALSNLYFRLWEDLDIYAKGHFIGDDAAYYYRVTD